LFLPIVLSRKAEKLSKEHSGKLHQKKLHNFISLKNYDRNNHKGLSSLDV